LGMGTRLPVLPKANLRFEGKGQARPDLAADGWPVQPIEAF